MSNKTDLQSLNADYAALIDTLRGKAAGGGSGGGVETCTVALYYPVNIITVHCTTLENGKVNCAELSVNASAKIIENVVCGSFFLVKSNAVYTPIPTIDGGGEFIRLANNFFQGYVATDEANGVMAVRMVDDD